MKKPIIYDGTKKKTARKVSTNSFEINVRFVIGLREISDGHEAMKTLTSCLNMNCLTPNGYNKIKQSVLVAYKDIAEKVCQEQLQRKIPLLTKMQLVSNNYYVLQLMALGKKEGTCHQKMEL